MYRNVTVGLLLVIFCFIIANNVFFVHVHRLPDGSTVKHAHPYQKNKELPGKQHQHSSVELVVIEQSNNYIASEVLSDKIVFRDFFFILQPGVELGYNTDISYNFGQRAPPFFVI
jgi:hypothetical protein